jgi:hypothetical protein
VYQDTAYWQKGKSHLHDDYKSLGLSVQQDSAIVDISFLTDHQSGIVWLSTIKSHVEDGRAVYVTGPHPFDSAATADHSNAHAYTVVSVNTDASGTPVSITLRNPYAGDQLPNGGYTTLDPAKFFSCAGRMLAFYL